ncbi:MAG: MFS transporter, partial [Acidaminococcales bacterium]|nr:MFS transporter [Acidaminococcales bacterium]
MNNDLWRIKDFRILILGQSICVLGDWFGIIAILALAGFRWQVTPVKMSMVLFVIIAPIVFFGPLGGVIADRTDRGRMLAAAGAMRAIVMLFIANVGEFYLLLFFLLLLGVLTACSTPAKNAKIKEIPPLDLVDDAVFYSSFVDQAARVFGPALGGSALAFFSVETALYFNAAAYFLGSVVFAFM